MLEDNKNLTCEFAEELVSYLYNELADAEKARFEKHLGDCSLCAEELSEFSLARYSVQEWRNEEFLPLQTPTIEIPYQTKTKLVENDGVMRSWLASVRALFTLSPAWTTATTALAALTICVGLFLVMFSSLPENDDVVVQSKNDNIKVSPSPTTGNQNQNSNVSNTNKTGQNQNSSSESNSAGKDAPVPLKTSTNPNTTKPQNLNIKKQVQPNKINKTPSKQTNQRPPSLLEEEEEDDTLRLSDLLEGIGADD